MPLTAPERTAARRRQEIRRRRLRPWAVRAAVVAAIALVVIVIVNNETSETPVVPDDMASTAAESTDATTNVDALQVPATWEPLGEPGVGGRITALAVDPSDTDHVLIGGDLLGTAVSVDGGNSWERSTGLLGHEVARFTFHPDSAGEVWVGTMSGPHVSLDGGTTWEPRRDGLPPTEEYFYSAPVEVVIVDQVDPDRLLAFGGSHREWESLGDPAWGVVWESTDRGRSWGRLAVIAEGTNVVSAIQLPDGTVLAAALGQGLHRSIDGGRSWQPVGAGLPHGNVREVIATSEPGVVYAALGEGPLEGEEHSAGGVYRSDDGGLTFEPRTEGLGQRRGATPELTSRYDALAVSNVDPDTLWTADLAFGIEAVYRSDDGGQSWAVEIAGDDRDDIATAYSSPVTAEVLVPAEGADELRFIAQSEYVLRRNAQGAWGSATSVRAGDGWAGTGFSGLVATDIAFDPARPDVLALTALDGGHYLQSTDSGLSWQRPLTSWDSWGGGQAVTIAGPGGDHVYVWLGQFGVFNGIAASTDGQQTWQFAAGAGIGLPERLDPVDPMGDVEAFPDEPSRVVATIDGDVYLSVDGGATWRQTLRGTYTALAINAADELHVADERGVYRLSRDADVPMELPGSPEAVDRLVSDMVGGLYAVRWGVDDDTDAILSRWDGTTWSQLCSDPGSCGPGFDRHLATIAVDPTNPDHLVAAMNDLPFHDVAHTPGLYQSTDAGESWTAIDDELPIARVSVVAFDPHRNGRLVIGTVGAGFYHRRL